MVSGHDVIVVDHKFEEHWLLLVGKWGIKAVLAVALIQSGLMLFRSKRHGNDHGIELGEGPVGQQGCPTLWTTNSRF
jgi:hypothetical protein